jgi:hypothetical protein
MAQETQAYKRSLSGSVGAGLSSVFSRAGRTYYILEHKVSSKYHKAGEAQEIIVDQIEIGRDSKCQVQYDESFQTVSRRHAAIVRDGENWKLVQLSQTNKTLLNGHEVQKEWYLQNGDEIQLSINGPKLGFIIPTGNKSKTGSIGLSRRLSLFRQQALKPYKTAMAIMSACIALLIVGGVGYGVYAHKQIGGLQDLINGYEIALNSVSEQNLELARQIAIQDSINKEIERRNRELAKKYNTLKQHAPENVQGLIAKANPSVYFIITESYLSYGGKTERVKRTSGTGFLLTDGRFVTARHCVESWLYGDPTSKANALPTTYPSDFKAYSLIYAVNSKGDEFVLRSSDFVIDRSMDCFANWMSDDGKEYKLRLVHFYENGNSGKGLYGTTKKMGSADWAYAVRDINGKALPKGNIEVDAQLANNLSSGLDVHALGFPAGLGVDDSDNKNEIVEPIYTSMKVARSGLNSAGMIMVTQGTAHGNSGGPVFAVKDGKLYAVGIVSRGMWETQKEGEQQQQFDELVPTSKVCR